MSKRSKRNKRRREAALAREIEARKDPEYRSLDSALAHTEDLLRSVGERRERLESEERNLVHIVTRVQALDDENEGPTLAHASVIRDAILWNLKERPASTPDVDLLSSVVGSNVSIQHMTHEGLNARRTFTETGQWFPTREVKQAWEEWRPQAKVFHLSMHQYRDLNLQNPYAIGIDEVFYIPPFPLYYMQVDSDLSVPLLDEPKYRDIEGRIDGLLCDTRFERWVFLERCSFTSQSGALLGHAWDKSSTIGVFFDPKDTSAGLILEDPSLGDRLSEQDRRSMKSAVLKIVWVALNFMLLLNSKEVEHVLVADPKRPPTRQLRRAQGYVDQPHYEIRLAPKATIRVALEHAVRMHRKHHKRPHDVRSHPRRYKSGKIAVVRAHRRGIRAHPEDKPVSKEYDAKPLGGEIRKAPFEV